MGFNFSKKSILDQNIQAQVFERIGTSKQYMDTNGENSTGYCIASDISQNSINIECHIALLIE